LWVKKEDEKEDPPHPKKAEESKEKEDPQGYDSQSDHKSLG